MALHNRRLELTPSLPPAAIRLDKLGKCYRLYARPQDRLCQAFWGRHRRYYREFWALQDISLSVPQGETLGIVGCNGSGKSTLLQLICGTLAPTTGTVATEGQIAALLELGSGFNPDFTGIENIYLNAGLLGYRRHQVDALLDDILAFADIGDFVHRPVKTYSTGMVVRLAFAVAIQSRSRIIIIDEALAVGDPAFQYKCYQRLRDLISSRRSTVLLVSHDLNAITEFCSSAMLLDRGRLVAQGSPKEVCALFRRRTNVLQASSREATDQPPADQQPVLLHGNDGLDTYGDGSATILSWDVCDAEGRSLRAFSNTEPISIRLSVRFETAASQPVAGFFLTDVKGRELVGTNTAIEQQPIGPRRAGEQVSVIFRQCLPLMAGSYFLNLGCSEIVAGNVVAKHRLYQVALLAIRSDRSQVGLFRLEASTSVMEEIGATVGSEEVAGT